MTELSCELSRRYNKDAFSQTLRDSVATDIIHQHSARLDYYKGCASPVAILIQLDLILIETSPNSMRQNQKETKI
jgi:hypothetical protein